MWAYAKCAEVTHRRKTHSDDSPRFVSIGYVGQVQAWEMHMDVCMHEYMHACAFSLTKYRHKVLSMNHPSTLVFVSWYKKQTICSLRLKGPEHLYAILQSAYQIFRSDALWTLPYINRDGVRSMFKRATWSGKSSDVGLYTDLWRLSWRDSLIDDTRLDWLWTKYLWNTSLYDWTGMIARESLATRLSCGRIIKFSCYQTLLSLAHTWRRRPIISYSR